MEENKNTENLQNEQVILQNNITENTNNTNENNNNNIIVENNETMNENVSNIQPNIELKKEKKDKKIFIFIILGVLILAAVGYVVAANTILKKGKNNNNNEEKEIVEDKDNISDKKDENKDSESLKQGGKKIYVIKVYENSINEYVRTIDNDEFELEEYEKLVATYNCSNEYYCRTIENNNDYVLILDSLREVVLYDINNKKAISHMTLPSNGYSIDDTAALVSNGNKEYGLIYYLWNSSTYEKTPVYYSLKENKQKFMLDGNYKLSVVEPYLEKGYIIATNSNSNSEELVNINTGKTFKTIKQISGDNNTSFTELRKKGDNYSYLGISNSDYKYNALNENFELMFDSYYDEITQFNGDYYAYNYGSNTYYHYISSTKKVEKKELDYKILSVINDNNIIAKSNDKLVIMDGNKLVKEISDYKDNDTYDEYHSGYYKKHGSKDAGIYMLITTEVEKNDGIVSGHNYEYYYDLKTGNVKKYDLGTEAIGGYAKPVLYLYPTKKTNITVNFEHEDMLTTTYPKFNKEWNVTASPNGDLYDKKGNYYYALYWEEEKNHTVDFTTGFYVEKDNAIEFLEEKLEYIGLSKKERNEFIMYWLPILEKNEKSLVYFELTEERDSYNKLLINPKPDSLLRVAIHVKKVDKKVDIKEQKLTKFNRKGFTAIEWGGVRYN